MTRVEDNLVRVLPSRADIFREAPHGSTGAEIGVYKGDFSATILGQCVVDRLYLIDPWCRITEGNFLNDPWLTKYTEENFEICAERFGRDSRVVMMRTTSLEAAASFVASGTLLDWVYLDACHAYPEVLADLEAWAPLIKPGGFLAGHDFHDDGTKELLGFGVRTAIATFCHHRPWRLDAVTADWPVSYILKRTQ